MASLTRRDRLDFLSQVPQMVIITKTSRYPLAQVNQALADLRAGSLEAAAVPVP